MRILAPKVSVVRSFYSGALELCYAACGKIDIRIDDSFKPWDVAAGALIAQEAGIFISDFQNNKWTLCCRSLLAATPSLHKQVIALLEK